MKKLALVAAAVFAASVAGSALAQTKGADMKAAQAAYKDATTKAKATFDTSIVACKKMAEDKQSACYKEARQARRKARDEAGDAYTKVTGKPEPSPGE
jgi:hypothetical protein